MIGKNTFTKEWIETVSHQVGRGKKNADPGLIEKVTKALLLLEELAKSDLTFIFKGGTSLLLLLNRMHRFSIDIDIIVDPTMQNADVGEILRKVVINSDVFSHFEENQRVQGGVPKAHYKVFYQSVLDGETNYILLDVLFEKNCYDHLMEKSIRCSLADYSDPDIKVMVPSVDCILADKLTAFAPNTTGIPYGKNKELEIIKQLFDVGNLFDEMKDLNVVGSTFRRMAVQELVYRDRSEAFTFENVLDDIFQTSRILSERGRIEGDTFQLLQTGVNRIKDYIFSRNYILESAINSASKAAYLALLLKNEIYDVERFDPKVDLRELVIENKDFIKFRTILKFDPEAYFYWYKCVEIINDKP